LRRWLLLVGRIGTVLIAFGLALLLVSLIPPARTSSFRSTGPYLSSLSFQAFGPTVPVSVNSTFDRAFLTTLTPQQELEIELTCNGTVDIYFLKTDKDSFLANFENGKSVSALEGYLQTHSEMIALHDKISLSGKVSYSPTEVINATVIVSNPSQNTIHINKQGDSTYSRIGPSQKAQMIAAFAIPVGFVFVLPLRLTQRETKTNRRLKAYLYRVLD
jgi:hypothetical protein